MKDLNFRRKNKTLTKAEMRELIKVEKKIFFENGGVRELLIDDIGH